MNTPAWMNGVSLGTVLVSVFVVLTVSGLLWAILRPLVRSVRRTDLTVQQLSRDWFGQEGRAGFPAIPGVPQRLLDVEQELAKLRPLVEQINREMHPNGGGSLRDQITKLTAAVEKTEDSRVQTARDMSEIKSEVGAVTRALESTRTLRALAAQVDGDDGRKVG